MRLFDTHCHFDSSGKDEIATLLRRAKEVGVERIVAIGGSDGLNRSAQLAAQVAHSGKMGEMPKVSIACGYDRDQIGKEQTDRFDGVGLVAWGEIGLDYFYSPGSRNEQMQLFGEQLEEARRRNLPVVIHTREADDDTLGLLREIPSRGIIHCFTGSPQYCRQLLDMGFYISVSGIVTFRAADNVRESVLVIPEDRLLIETDSPYLAPIPKRGKANEPSFLVHTAMFLARLRGWEVEDLAEKTYVNAMKVFGLE